MALLAVNFMSSVLRRPVTANVVLPTDRNPSDAPLRMLVLLHGALGNCNDWVTNTRIQSLAEEKNICVIMPSGENSFYLDNPLSSNYFGTYVGEELPVLMRRMFNLSSRREDCFISGLSMGGFGALRLGLKYSDTFGAAAPLSGAYVLHEPDPANEDEEVGKMGFETSCFGSMRQGWESPENNPLNLARALKERERAGEAVNIPRIYMACGTEDALYSANCFVRDELLSMGYELSWEQGPGRHEWDFWDRFIERVLDWL